MVFEAFEFSDDTDADPTYFPSSYESGSTDDSDFDKLIKKEKLKEVRSFNYVIYSDDGGSTETRVSKDKRSRNLKRRILNKTKIISRIRSRTIKQCSNVTQSLSFKNRSTSSSQLNLDVSGSSNYTSGFCSGTDMDETFSSSLIDCINEKISSDDNVGSLSTTVVQNMSENVDNIGVSKDDNTNMPEKNTNMSEDHTNMSEKEVMPSTSQEHFIDIVELFSLYVERSTISPHILWKFQKLDITITWELPEAHSVRNSLSYKNRKQLSQSLSESGLEIKTGRFSKKEDNIIINNWHNFRTEYDFDDNPSLFFPGIIPTKVLKNKQKRYFVQYISRGLPERLLRTVYDRFCVLFEMKLNMGAFTFKEDLLISELEKVPDWFLTKNFEITTKCKILSKVLNRDRLAVYRRQLLLRQSEDPPKRVNWSLDLCEKLVNLLIVTTQSSDIKDLIKVHALCVTDEHWDYIAKQLNCGNGKQLKIFWFTRLSVQLSCKKPVYRNKLRKELILWFHKNLFDLPEYWKLVQWNKISKHFRLPSLFLHRKFRKMVMTYVPMAKIESVTESVIHLHKHFLPFLEKGVLKDFCLKRLRYTHNKLKELN